MPPRSKGEVEAKAAAVAKRRRKPPGDPPKRRARVALTEVEDIVRQLMETHRYSPWLDTEAAAKYLCRSVGTLKRWRSDDEGPVYRVINRKLIRYHVDDLDAFVRGGSVRGSVLTMPDEDDEKR